MPAREAIGVSKVTHRYGSRTALDGLDLSIQQGELFAVLGPNGGGKTTLFRLLSTLIPLQAGSVSVEGLDLARRPRQVQALLGVVFQAPSLDKKLSVAENLRYQAALYGLSGPRFQSAQTRLLEQLGLSDRARDRVETLSGGLRRRVELAKGLLHDPRVLLLDEPSTGLDPGARGDLWRLLTELRETRGVTIVLTTHLLEEAERVDRLAILDQGRLVALDTPAALQATVGADTLLIEAERADELAEEIRRRLDLPAATIDGVVRLEAGDGPALVAQVAAAFPKGRIRAITLRKPSLEDVFIARTGKRFWTAEGGNRDA